MDGSTRAVQFGTRRALWLLWMLVLLVSFLGAQVKAGHDKHAWGLKLSFEIPFYIHLPGRTNTSLGLGDETNEELQLAEGPFNFWRRLSRRHRDRFPVCCGEC